MSDEIAALVRQLASHDRTICYQASTRLGELGEAVIDELIAVLDDSTIDDSWLNHTFKLIGAPAVEPLIHVLQDDSSSLRQQRAALVLGEIGDARAIPSLLAALHHADEEVRAEAAAALGSFTDAEAVGDLLVALEDESALVRAKAAWSLGNFDDVRTIEKLLRATDDPDAQVRRGAIWSLAKLQVEQAIPKFKAALQDPDKEVQQLAVVALRKISGDATALEQYQAIGSKTEALEVQRILDAIRPDDGLDESEMDKLRHSNPRIRARLLMELGQIQAKGAVSALLTALNDINPAVRSTAVASLTKMGDNALDAMIEATSHHSKYVREGAAQVLGNLKNPQAVDALISLLKDSAVQVRAAAADALGSIGDERAINPLKRALGDPDEKVRANAEKSLVRMGENPTSPGGYLRKMFGRLRGSGQKED